MLQKWARAVVYTARIIGGYVVYLFFRKTPSYGHLSMVGLFCLTQGSSNDVLSRAIGVVKRPYRLANADGVLGDMSVPERREPIVTRLRSDGYYVFPECVPETLCERLLRYAVSHRCKTRMMDGGKPGSLVETVYPRGAPQAVRYDFETQDLLANEDVQKLLADLSMVALAQSYLGARPVADVLTMWWHTAYSQIPDSEAAQYFHFDMDRPKWLKYFIYLTDVEPVNGPHSFVAGSHRTREFRGTCWRKAMRGCRMRRLRRCSIGVTSSSLRPRAARSSQKTPAAFIKASMLRAAIGSSCRYSSATRCSVRVVRRRSWDRGSVRNCSIGSSGIPDCMPRT